MVPGEWRDQFGSTFGATRTPGEYFGISFGVLWEHVTFSAREDPGSTFINLGHGHSVRGRPVLQVATVTMSASDWYHRRYYAG